MIKNSQLIKVMVNEIMCKLDTIQEISDHRDVILMSVAAKAEVQVMKILLEQSG